MSTESEQPFASVITLPSPLKKTDSSVCDSCIPHFSSHEPSPQMQCSSTQSFEEVNTEQLFMHSSRKRTHFVSDSQEEDDLLKHYKNCKQNNKQQKKILNAFIFKSKKKKHTNKKTKKTRKKDSQTTSSAQSFCSQPKSRLLQLTLSSPPVVEHTDKSRVYMQDEVPT
jgi:hypothetical protein